MSNGYITRRPIKDITANFKRKFSNIDEFINNNFIKDDLGVSDSNLEVTEPFSLKISKSRNLSYLEDDGTGRISKGVLALDLICKIVQGIPPASLTLFDQQIYSLPTDFKLLNINDARTNINENLGMVQFIPLAYSISPIIVENYNIFTDKIAKTIKSGYFTTDLYLQETLRQCKLIVKTSMNIKNRGSII